MSGDDDTEDSIHLKSYSHGVDAEVYFNETNWGDGYSYQVSFHFRFEEWYDSTNEEEFMIMSWTVGTSIYSYIHLFDIEGEKDGFFNFTTSRPISSCYLSSENEIVYWVSDDNEPLSYPGSSVHIVEDIYNFEFSHYLFTDYAMYAIQNHVTFCPVLLNQSLGSEWYTISRSVQWKIDKVAIFDSSPDQIISEVNATSSFGFYMGGSQDWTRADQIINGTGIPGNGTTITTSRDKTQISDPFPHQVIYRLKLESGNASALCTADIAFVSTEYFPSESVWSLLPGWAKFTIIGGSISLIGCAAYIAQVVFTLLNKRKSRVF
ncbi:MAG: hypothetical protein ACTSRD_06840 [Promethearchaeota archaeon]